MADNLTDTAANLMLDWVNGVGNPTRPTPPLELALLTALGTDTAAGTEVAGDTYARPTLTLAGAAAGSASNTAELSVVIDTAAARDIVGVEVYDAVGVRTWHGALTANKTVNASDPIVFAVGELDLTLG